MLMETRQELIPFEINRIVYDTAACISSISYSGPDLKTFCGGVEGRGGGDLIYTVSRLILMYLYT